MERHKIINHMERKKEPSAVIKGGIFALIALLISYLGFSIPTFVESLKQDIQWRASALQLSLEPILFGGVVFMPIVCAWASYVPYHVEVMRSGFVSFCLIRSDWRKYAMRHITRAFFMGAAVVGGSFFLHAFIMNILATPYDVLRFPSQELPFMEGTFAFNMHKVCYGLPLYLTMTLCHGVFGGAWCLIGLSLSTWMKDSIISLSMMLCIKEFWIVFPRRILGKSFPSPSLLLYEDLTLYTLLLSLAVYVVVCCIAVVLYVWGLKRSVRNE